MKEDLKSKLKIELDVLNQYCRIIGESSPTSCVVIGNIEKDQIINKKFEIEEGERWASSFKWIELDQRAEAIKAYEKYKNDGFVMMNLFDWYYTKRKHLENLLKDDKS